MNSMTDFDKYIRQGEPESKEKAQAWQTAIGLQDVDGLKPSCKFVSDIWQIHPFGEGNTRTTAVFTMKYLHTFGFTFDNSVFQEHSWYFNVSSTNYSTQYQRFRTDVTISSKSLIYLRVTPLKFSPIEGRTYCRIRSSNPL